MMILRKIAAALFCTFALAFVAGATATVSAQEMTYEEYKVKLAGYESRTAEARRALAACKEGGDKLRAEIAGIDGQVAQVNSEVYELLGTNQAGIDAYLAELTRIEARLMGLLNMSEEALFEKRDEIDSIEARVAELKMDNKANLPDAAQKLANIDQLLERVKARMPRKRIKQYTVVRGDNLWNIAKKPSIYSDPYLWPRIYVENKAKIKNPDMIYPNWTLNVPFGVDLNQHLVVGGQSLSSIAGMVYKDPTKWHRLLKANQSQILEGNLIFPAQVLDVPAN
jgi:nucleoid-associated protein YgaU